MSRFEPPTSRLQVSGITITANILCKDVLVMDSPFALFCSWRGALLRKKAPTFLLHVRAVTAELHAATSQIALDLINYSLYVT